ncbi:MAG: hypothetical protein M3140_03850 [Actinomycetota bacterium]|nr:hypothetical protein [Actinomycetota bacterium]
MAHYRYVGRHRLGRPGLVHVWALMTRPAGRSGRRWFGLRLGPVKHGATVVALPVRPARLHAASSRAA